MKLRTVVAGIALVAAACGCSLPPVGNKAGGAPAPVVLHLAATGVDVMTDIPPVARFVHEVETLSGGNLKILPENSFGDFEPDAEVQVVQAVASDKVDLGITSSAVYDTLGVRSLQALSAPMLIDSYALERAVLDTSLPTEMLDGLGSLHVSGITVFGDGLRLPIGVRRAILSPTDWRGLGFGTYRSGTQEQAIRSLGANAVEAFGTLRAQYIVSGRIQGFEFDANHLLHQGARFVSEAPYLAFNVHLWPRVDVLLGNPARLATLSEQQRGWLREAAADAERQSVTLGAETSGTIAQLCADGAHFARAAPADLNALRAGFSSVYASLGQDRQTADFIRRIVALKDTAPGDTPLTIPSGCLTP